MLECSRRRLLRRGALGAVGLLAGCIGGDSDRIDVRVTNEDATEHDVDVRVTGDFAPVTESVTLASGASETLRDVIPLLDYDHTVTVAVRVDGSAAVTDEYAVGDDLEYGERAVAVVVGEGGAASIGVTEG